MTHDVFTTNGITTPVAPPAYRPCAWCETTHAPGEDCAPLYTTPVMKRCLMTAFGLGLLVGALCYAALLFLGA